MESIVTKFPSDFLMGSATAALQIEGATEADGRGPSVWDQFCRQHPERVHERATPEIATDHYYRWSEDVAWMQRLGHSSYRFSIAWPRVVPNGRGAVNPKGLDFYERLVDALLAANIEPNITLYHWDLPLDLAQLGGWENPATVDAFGQFAQACFERLKDRVKLWASINEPAWTTLNGYLTGLHPPLVKDRKRALLAAHHLLCAHGQATSLHPCGIALNLSPVYPATESSEDREAARLADGVLNDWFLEAVVKGRYPDHLLGLYERLGIAPQSPHSLGRVPPSFLGVNYYYPHHASAGASQDEFHINNTGQAKVDCKFALEGCFRMVRNPRGQYTDWAWEIDPATLTTLLLQVAKKAPETPLYVTENGIGLPDRLEGGEVNDDQRIEFVRAHLLAIHRALSQGCPIRGYYMWSLLDNFSWINGYKKRYGFLYVDRTTQERTAKKSAHWFESVARTKVLS